MKTQRAPLFQERDIAPQPVDHRRDGEFAHQHGVVVIVEPDLVAQPAPLLKHLALATHLPTVRIIVSVQCAGADVRKHHHQVPSAVEERQLRWNVPVGIAVGGNLVIREFPVHLVEDSIHEVEPLVAHRSLHERIAVV